MLKISMVMTGCVEIVRDWETKSEPEEGKWSVFLPPQISYL